MTEDYWYGDEEGEELPVLLGPVEPSAARRPRLPVPRGNVSEAQAGEARAAVLSEAKGKGTAEVAPWRDEMDLGRRDRAASALASARGHDAYSGFGLA